MTSAVAAPWSELRDVAHEVAEMPATPLPAACAVVALAALGDDDGLTTLLSNADRLAGGGTPPPARVLHAVAEAARASFAGAWTEVADALLPVRVSSGRSAAAGPEREVFEDALLYGLIRGNRAEEAGSCSPSVWTAVPRGPSRSCWRRC